MKKNGGQKSCDILLSNFVVRCRVIEVFSVYRRFNLCINNYTYKKYLQNNLRNSVKPACEVATHNMIKHRDSIPLISVRVISCNSKSFSMLFFGITNSLSNINYYIFLLHIQYTWLNFFLRCILMNVYVEKPTTARMIKVMRTSQVTRSNRPDLVRSWR